MNQPFTDALPLATPHKDHESGRKGSRDQCPGSKRVNKLRKVGPLSTETLFTETRLVHDGDIDAPKILMDAGFFFVT